MTDERKPHLWEELHRLRGIADQPFTPQDMTATETEGTLADMASLGLIERIESDDPVDPWYRAWRENNPLRQILLDLKWWMEGLATTVEDNIRDFGGE